VKFNLFATATGYNCYGQASRKARQHTLTELNTYLYYKANSIVP